MIELRQATDRKSWLAWRRGGIGASDAAAIAGMDPFKGPMSIFLDKSGLLADDDEGEYRRWGNLLEPAIAEEFEERTGLYVPRVSRALMLEHKEHPWMRATIDGFVVENKANATMVPLGVLEIKTVAGFKSRDWADEVPEHFQIQVAHQLAVTGADHAWLAVLFGGQQLEIRELERDDELIESLIGLENAFWHNHVLANQPPASDGYEATTKDLRRAFSSAGGEPVVLPVEVEEMLLERASAKADVKAAEARVAAIDQTLMTLLGDAEVGLLGGRPRITWKRHERSTIDLETFRNQHPALAQQLTVRSPYRVLRLVGAREDEG